MNTRKKEILTGLAIVAVAAGLLIALELGSWLFRHTEQGQQRAQQIAGRYYVDPTTGLRLATPNMQTGIVRTNNLGFRGPDIAQEKPENTFRIAFLGSSTAKDILNPEGLNWPHLLAEQFRAVVEGCDLDYVNAGMPGYSFPKMAILYEKHVAQTDPDLVIVMPGGIRKNLHPLAKQQGFKVNRDRSGAQSGPLALLRDKLNHGVNVINYVLADNNDSKKLQLDSQAVARKLTADLQSLLEVVSDGQRLVAVVTSVNRLAESMPAYEQAWVSPTLLERFPFLHLPDYIELRKSYNRMLPEAVAGYRAIVLPGIDELPHNSNFFTDRIHFSLLGARVMSEQMFRQLIGHPELGALFAARGCSLAQERGVALTWPELAMARGRV